jgi:hypothetical protein
MVYMHRSFRAPASYIRSLDAWVWCWWVCATGRPDGWVTRYLSADPISIPIGLRKHASSSSADRNLQVRARVYIYHCSSKRSFSPFTRRIHTTAISV